MYLDEPGIEAVARVAQIGGRRAEEAAEGRRRVLACEPGEGRGQGKD